jgi:glycosyltransferase involved in cell wall biosynthesis
LARWSEEYTWRNAQYLLPVTEVLGHRVKQVSGIRTQAVAVIPNGVSVEFTNRTIEPKEVPNKKEGQVVVGFVGFCREWHQLDYVLDVLAEEGNEHMYFLLVGDGPVLESLKAQTRALGLGDRVCFTGLVDRDDIPLWLATIDIALQPAVVPYASPLKLIEYLAMGKAIVAPAQPNIEELLTNNENALLFEEDNREEFLGCLRRLANDGQLRRQLGEGAKATIKEKGLTWDANVERIRGIAEEVMSERGKGA